MIVINLVVIKPAANGITRMKIRVNSPDVDVRYLNVGVLYLNAEIQNLNVEVWNLIV